MSNYHCRIIINEISLKFDTLPQIQFDLTFLSELKHESLSRHHWSIDLQCPSVRHGYGLQIVCSVMIYEQHRTTADYNGDSLRNWLDENYCASCRSRKKRLNQSSRVLFFFLIYPSNLRGNSEEIFRCVEKTEGTILCHSPTSRV